jgi:pimeloyl-ACP methyl ester carboxylesterase
MAPKNQYKKLRSGNSPNFITLDGVKLETAWHGPGPNEVPTLVFLHEGLGCVSMWRDFPAQVATATGCGALVYSRQGYGRSDACDLPRPIEFMHHEGLRVLPDIIKTLGINDHMLIGHSDGGSIALLYAGHTKDQGLRGVITEAAHVICEPISVKSIQTAKKMYLENNLRSKLAKHHGPNTDNAFWGWNDIWLDPDFLKWNIENHLPGINVPMLVMQGADDPYGTWAQVEAILSGTSKHAQALKIKACGHCPHFEQPSLTFNTMVDFIHYTLHV